MLSFIPGIFCFGQDSVRIQNWNFKNSTLDTVYQSAYTLYQQKRNCHTYIISSSFEAYDSMFDSDCIMPNKCYSKYLNTFKIHSINDQNLQLCDSLKATIRHLWLSALGQDSSHLPIRKHLLAGELMEIDCGFLSRNSTHIPIVTKFIDKKHITYLAEGNSFIIIESEINDCGYTGFIEQILALWRGDKLIDFKYVENDLYEVDILLKNE